MAGLLMRWLFLALAAAVLGGCSTAHTARPLGQGNHAVHVSVGGPIVGIGDQQKIVVPLTTLTYKYGLTDRADVFVGWHVLETFVNEGNAFFDIGTSYYFLDQRGARPGLSGAVTISPLVNKRSGWASVDLQLTASWFLDPGERHLLYLGAHNFLSPVRSQLLPTPVYTLSPYLGGQLRLGRHREVVLGLEMKWHRPYADTSKMVLSWVGLAKRGAFAFVGGVTVAFGKRDRNEEHKNLPTESEEEPPATTPEIAPEVGNDEDNEGATDAQEAESQPADVENAEPAPSESKKVSTEPQPSNPTPSEQEDASGHSEPSPTEDGEE